METNETLIKEAKNKYHREWYAKNKEKVKEANKRYWEKKAAALAFSKQSGECNGEKQD